MQKPFAPGCGRVQIQGGRVPEAVTTCNPAPRARVQAMKEYHPPLGCRDALRLDFNENTLACSPKVREVLGRISAGSLTRYPEREPVEAIVAAHLGLAAAQVALTNGVDEGIHVLVEAYFHFHGETVIDQISVVPNLIVARTLSNAYGLAGLRLGLLAGPVELMRWVRRVLSPYSVNSLALACLPPALEDTAYLDWYVAEVLAARAEFEAALDAAGVRRWPSRANFVLIEIGPRHAEFVRLMGVAGVLVRDRSSDPGCDGRIRITIGTREQMRQAASALHEVLTVLNRNGGSR